ncbi:MAG: hypothetical protein GY895_00215 [Phycisphaera sp.]|nr:hypothetical protein [Phycisphaera sp.]
MNRPTTTRKDGRRRGAALLLVLVAMAIGLLLTATWLDGRRESIPVAERVSDGTSARHAAAGGLELAIATLQAEDDWRAAVEAGRLDSPFAFDDASLEFTTIDADDGEEVDSKTLRVTVRCRAVIDGLAATGERTVEFPPEESVVDLGFGETAIMVDREIRILDRAAVLAWRRPGAPDSGAVVMGTLDGDPDRIEVGPDSLLPSIETILVQDRRTPSRTVASRMRELPDELPGLAAPMVPDADAPHPGSGQLVKIKVAPTEDLIGRTIRIPRNTTIEIEGDLTIHALENLEIQPGARLIVDGGTLHLDVDRDFKARDAEIAVGPTGRIVIRAGRRLQVENAFIGDAAHPGESVDRGRMLPMEAAAAVGRIVLTGRQDAEITISGDSIVTGTIIAPEANMHVVDSAVLHGRIVAARVEFRNEAMLYARPDDGRMIGMTSLSGPHRDGEGLLKAVVQTPDRGCPAVLEEIAEALGVAVCATGTIALPSETAIATRAGKVEAEPDLRMEDRRGRITRSHGYGHGHGRMRWISAEGGGR